MLTVSMALAGVLVRAGPANAAIDRPVGVWQMDEGAGSQTMVDSSGNGLNGVIGTNVQEATALPGGGTGYRFPYKRPNTPPADPQHLATVPHDTRLNPGSGDYAVEFRMRTTHSFGNVIQKGQAGAPGGYWKFQQPSGKISCLFRGSGGSSTASAGSTVRVNDGAWHTVRCERTPSMVTMIIDGVVTGRNRNATGTIANTRPVTIAGKGNCDQVEITCDYFSGDIDYVRIETS
ncbi:MAG TPA: LamG-like jellyroll fold domain-containing protein [Actinomycetes bacterium]|nr:LamG-like jellyroll fold domain-containing protein [Actinomycetes bacterium]